jgi:hypothetical protein
MRYRKHCNKYRKEKKENPVPLRLTYLGREKASFQFPGIPHVQTPGIVSSMHGSFQPVVMLSKMKEAEKKMQGSAQNPRSVVQVRAMSCFVCPGADAMLPSEENQGPKQ